jgi:Spy/CpxP family protein refolding chaperone
MTTPSTGIAATLGPAEEGGRKPTLWVALAIIAIALAGALGGIAVDRALHAHGPMDVGRGGPGGPGGRGGFGRRGGMFGAPPSDSARARMRARMAKELELTPVQQQQVDSLMSAQAPKFRALREKFEPAMDSLVHETQAQMDKILTPEQQAKAKAMREKWRSGRGGRGGPPGGPPPGP